MMENKFNLVEIIKDNTVKFLYLQRGVAHYAVKYRGASYSFPVPLNDVGDGKLEASDKASFYMRWIRKAIDEGVLKEII